MPPRSGGERAGGTSTPRMGLCPRGPRLPGRHPRTGQSRPGGDAPPRPVPGNAGEMLGGWERAPPGSRGRGPLGGRRAARWLCGPAPARGHRDPASPGPRSPPGPGPRSPPGRLSPPGPAGVCAPAPWARAAPASGPCAERGAWVWPHGEGGCRLGEVLSRGGGGGWMVPPAIPGQWGARGWWSVPVPACTLGSLCKFRCLGVICGSGAIRQPC